MLVLLNNFRFGLKDYTASHKTPEDYDIISHWGLISGKHWSFWDMANVFRAADFADRFALVVSAYHVIESGINVLGPDGMWRLERATYDELKRKTGELIGILSDAGLDVSASVAEDAFKALNSAVVQPDGFFGLSGQALQTARGHYREITTAVGRELRGFMTLILSKREAELLFPQSPLFGNLVFEKFDAARQDIEEAGKCLALNRATATVFHLMRALESAVHKIAATIGATIVDEHGRGLGWGVIAQNMKTKIDVMPRGSPNQISWYRVQADLAVVNRAWRVPTNHPMETYTVEQAIEIFDAVRAFMKELAPLI